MFDLISDLWLETAAANHTFQAFLFSATTTQKSPGKPTT